MSIARTTVAALAIAVLLPAGCTEKKTPRTAAAGMQHPRADEATPSPARVPPAGRSVRREGVQFDRPVLDAGTVPTYGHGAATVTLTNYQAEPVTLLACRSSCGCATADCPENRVIDAGESLAVQVRVNGDTRPMRFEKEIAFLLEGAPPMKLLVKAETVSAIAAEPWDLTPGKTLTLRAEDQTPFLVTGSEPPLLANLASEAAARHEVAIDWARWRRSGTPDKLTVLTDHPDCPRVLVMIEAPPPE